MCSELQVAMNVQCTCEKNVSYFTHTCMELHIRVLHVAVELVLLVHAAILIRDGCWTRAYMSGFLCHNPCSSQPEQICQIKVLYSTLHLWMNNKCCYFSYIAAQAPYRFHINRQGELLFMYFLGTHDLCWLSCDSCFCTIPASPFCGLGCGSNPV